MNVALFENHKVVLPYMGIRHFEYKQTAYFPNIKPILYHKKGNRVP